VRASSLYVSCPVLSDLGLSVVLVEDANQGYTISRLSPSGKLRSFPEGLRHLHLIYPLILRGREFLAHPVDALFRVCSGEQAPCFDVAVGGRNTAQRPGGVAADQGLRVV
jgi:hypothetical protein